MMVRVCVPSVVEQRRARWRRARPSIARPGADRVDDVLAVARRAPRPAARAAGRGRRAGRGWSRQKLSRDALGAAVDALEEGAASRVESGEERSVLASRPSLTPLARASTPSRSARCAHRRLRAERGRSRRARPRRPWRGHRRLPGARRCAYRARRAALGRSRRSPRMTPLRARVDPLQERAAARIERAEERCVHSHRGPRRHPSRARRHLPGARCCAHRAPRGSARAFASKPGGHPSGACLHTFEECGSARIERVRVGRARSRRGHRRHPSPRVDALKQRGAA